MKSSIYFCHYKVLLDLLLLQIDPWNSKMTVQDSRNDFILFKQLCSVHRPIALNVLIYKLMVKLFACLKFKENRRVYVKEDYIKVNQ